MAISQTRLDAMIVEQRTMFPNERLLVDVACGASPLLCPDCPNCDRREHPRNASIESGATCKLKAHHCPISALGQRLMNTYNPCNFFCEDCDISVTIHRYGRPFIDPMGRLVRRCMNDGISRRHTNNDRERCTDKHVLLKKYQVHRGIPAHLRSQMENPDAQIARELERQERRETTNERPSDFGPAPRSTSARPMTDFTERLRRDGLVTAVNANDV